MAELSTSGLSKFLLPGLGLFFAHISSEDPTGSWLTMSWGFDGAVLGSSLALKKN